MTFILKRINAWLDEPVAIPFFKYFKTLEDLERWGVLLLAFFFALMLVCINMIVDYLMEGSLRADLALDYVVTLVMKTLIFWSMGKVFFTFGKAYAQIQAKLQNDRDS